MEDSIKDLIKEIQVLDVKPNQALCVKFSSLIKPDVAQKFQNILEEQLGCKVLVFSPEVELTVIDVGDSDERV